MFSSGPSYPKLKTNLRLAINRLKLLEKKKTELALKARKEIADYISTGKTERAKIRVEHIIREDYMVEAMEVVEMYCDLLLARFGLIQQMKDLDEGLAEAISSLIWVAPRLQTDVAEVKLIADQLTLKYGKPYAIACREQAVGTVSEKLIHKLSVQAPPKVLVENYLVEIAKNYNIEYQPDPQIMREADWGSDPLISLVDPPTNDLGGATGGGSGGGGGAAMNIPYPVPDNQPKPFDYPQLPEKSGFPDENLPNVLAQPYMPNNPPPPDMSADTMGDVKHPTSGGQYHPGIGVNTGGSDWDAMMGLNTSPPPPYSSTIQHPPTAPPQSFGVSHNFPPDMSAAHKPSNQPRPAPAPRSKFDAAEDNANPNIGFNMPDLPSVPDLPGANSKSSYPTTPKDDDDDIDFDDLNKRFEELKRKK